MAFTFFWRFKFLICLIFIFTQITWGNSDFCSHVVKEGERLEIILKSYMLQKGTSNKEMTQVLYSSEGLLNQVSNLNKISSVNTLYPGQVLKIPCHLLPKKEEGKESLSLAEHNSVEEGAPEGLLKEVSFKLKTEYINSDDEINATKGNIFLFPVVVVDGRFYKYFSKTFYMGLKVFGEYGKIDSPSRTRSLSDNFFFNKFIGLSGGMKKRDYDYTFSIGRDESIFFRALNLTAISVNTYHFLTSSFGLHRSFYPIGKIGFEINYAASVMASSQFDSGYGLKITQERKTPALSDAILGFEFGADLLKTSNETQLNTNFAVSFKTEL